MGIFDPEGLVAYAAYFRDALVAGLGMDLTLNGEAVDKLFLVLQYRIGTSRLEGRIELRLKQSDLSPEVFSMMKSAYHFDPTRKVRANNLKYSVCSRFSKHLCFNPFF